MTRSTRAALCLALALTPAPAYGQADPIADEPLRLFFDCTTMGCFDPDFFRREVPVVSWVNDRQVADLHVLVTSQATGGGGRLYTMAFIGLGALEGEGQELTVSTRADATEDERRNAVAERLKLGLVRYLAGTPAAEQIRVSMGPPPGGPGGPGGPPSGAQIDDPWNFWTFRINGNWFSFGESSVSTSNAFGSVNADRVTEAWKVNIGSNFSRYLQTFQYTDTAGVDRTVRELQREWGVEASLVRSVGPQWAIGLRTDVGGSDFLNQSLRVAVKPGLEYNFYPYAESSRRSLTLQYLVGPMRFEYDYPTIYEKEVETTVQQSLVARLSLIQPWGRWSTSLTGNQYLHETNRYSVSASGNFNIRIFRGFSIRMSGSYTWIRDQIYLSSEGATDEQVLLRQRQLATNFRYNTSIGIEYRFGSIFNSVVNPRFGGSGGEVFFF
jgi:hypothetical protein